MAEEKEIYHIVAPQNEEADTEADRAIKDQQGRVIDETYATDEDLSDKQDTLVSGENIKTINNSSILGSGNLDIESIYTAENTDTIGSLCEALGITFPLTEYEYHTKMFISNAAGTFASGVGFVYVRQNPEYQGGFRFEIQLITTQDARKYVVTDYEEIDFSKPINSILWTQSLDYVPNLTGTETDVEYVLTAKNHVKQWKELSMSPLIETTWSALKALKDASLLIPGMQYRITDYVFSVDLQTSSLGIATANHAFDIIVVANSASELCEDARAIQHDGDTYFNNKKLYMWELKYCLNNDNTRFDWANQTDGKGVIYYMKDEFGNSAPYDFKNALFSFRSGDRYVSNKYTFYYVIGSTTYDMSLLGHHCNGNVIDSTFNISSQRYAIKQNVMYIPQLTSSYKCIGNHIKTNSTKNILYCVNSSAIGVASNENYVNDCSNVELSDDCSNNDIRHASYISMKHGCNGNTINTKQCSNIIYESAVKFTTLSSSASGSGRIQNVKVCQCVHGTSASSQKTLDVPTLDSDNLTVFMPTDATTYIV